MNGEKRITVDQNGDVINYNGHEPGGIFNPNFMRRREEQQSEMAEIPKEYGLTEEENTYLANNPSALAIVLKIITGYQKPEQSAETEISE